MPGTVRNFSIKLHEKLETSFYRLGILIATYPKLTVFISIFAAAASTPGLFFCRNMALDDVASWIPEDHLYSKIDRWVWANFKDGGLRYETFILSNASGNVLNARTFRKLHDLEKKLEALNSSGVTWEAVCARPGEFLDSGAQSRRKRLTHPRKHRSIFDSASSALADSSSIVVEKTQSSAPGNQHPSSASIDGNSSTSEVALRAPSDGVGAENTSRTTFQPSSDNSSAASGTTEPSAKKSTRAAFPSPVNLFDDDDDDDFFVGVSEDGDGKAGVKKKKNQSAKAETGPAAGVEPGGDDDEVYDLSDLVDALNDDAFDDDVLADNCLVSSPTKLWPTSSNAFEGVSDEEILKKIDDALHRRIKVPSSVHDVKMVISGMTFGERGEVTGAKAVVVTYMLKDRSVLMPGEFLKRDATAELWELEFLKVLATAQEDFVRAGESIVLSRFASRSYADGVQDILRSNIRILCSGFILIFAFLCLTFGPFNRLESRVYLAMGTLLILAISIYATFCFGMLLTLEVSILHSMVPFLILGIGVDDAYVILQSLDNMRGTLPPSTSLSHFIAKGLSQAGVSITVTSVTDILAFAIGAVAKVPIMRSYCIYCSIGIFSVYLLQLGLFLPLIYFDEKRRLANRDAFLLKKLPIPYSPTWPCGKFQPLDWVFNRLGWMLSCLPGKAAALLTCLALLGINSYGTSMIGNDFDRFWYLADGSYQKQFLQELSTYFPENSFRADLFIGNIDYHKEKLHLEVLYQNLVHLPSVHSGSVRFWYKSFLDWVRASNETYPKDEKIFKRKLRAFLLNTGDGRLFLNDIRYEGHILGHFNITASRILYRHVELSNATAKYQALDDLATLVQSTKFSTGNRFIGFLSPDYLTWAANRELMGSLPYSLGCTLLGVLVVITVMLGSVKVSLLTFSCVLLTLVDVIGTMHFWGLTLENQTSVLLVVSVGLCIDYSAHVGHEFLTTYKTDPDERLRETLRKIGPAVFKGAFSSFLAFVLCSQTSSYAFRIWYQVITCVTVFGVFHGCVVMPVLLGFLNPSGIPRVPSPTEPELRQDSSGRAAPVVGGSSSARSNGGGGNDAPGGDSNYGEDVVGPLGRRRHRRKVAPSVVSIGGNCCIQPDVLEGAIPRESNRRLSLPLDGGQEAEVIRGQPPPSVDRLAQEIQLCIPEEQRRHGSSRDERRRQISETTQPNDVAAAGARRGRPAAGVGERLRRRRGSQRSVRRRRRRRRRRERLAPSRVGGGRHQEQEGFGQKHPREGEIVRDWRAETLIKVPSLLSSCSHYKAV